MAETYKIIAIVTYTLAVVFLISSAALWFKFKIVTVFQKLTGKIVKKSTQKSSQKVSLQSPVSEEIQSGLTGSEFTELTDEDGSAKTAILSENEGSSHTKSGIDITADFLESGMNTQILDDELTDKLESQEDTTGEMSESQDESEFRILESIIIIHTEEVI